MSGNSIVTGELVTLSVMFFFPGYGITAVYVGIFNWKLEMQLSK